jgi:hypothetical protein
MRLSIKHGEEGQGTRGPGSDKGEQEGDRGAMGYPDGGRRGALGLHRWTKWWAAPWHCTVDTVVHHL